MCTYIPDHKGLAISLPITCYGLSALLGAQILKLPYFHRRRVGFGSCVSVFAWLYLVVGIASFVSSSIVIVELELLFGVTPDENGFA